MPGDVSQKRQHGRMAPSKANMTWSVGDSLYIGYPGQDRLFIWMNREEQGSTSGLDILRYGVLISTTVRKLDHCDYLKDTDSDKMGCPDLYFSGTEDWSENP